MDSQWGDWIPKEYSSDKTMFRENVDLNGTEIDLDEQQVNVPYKEAERL